METCPTNEKGEHALRAFVGCRTTVARSARGRGIEVFDVSNKGEWAHRYTVIAGDNPSYLLADATGHRLHCAHGDGSTLSTYDVTPGVAPVLLSTRSTQGTNPVHLAFSPGGRWLLVANYATGSVASMPIKGDGSAGEVASLLRLPANPGPHRSQQQGAHPHQLVFDPAGRWLLVPDKGGDAIHTIELDEATGAMRIASALRTAPMSGPRHLAFNRDGRKAWVMLELSSQVLATSFDPTTGALTATQRSSSVPDSFVSENTGAGIALDESGDFVCVSNRGHGSLARFAIDQVTGALHAPTWSDTGGKVPRFVVAALRANTFLVANEDADTIVQIDFDSPDLRRTVARAGSPVCIAFTKGTP